MDLYIQNVSNTSGISENTTNSSGNTTGQTSVSMGQSSSIQNTGVALLQELNIGDVFSGEITNITQNNITVALSDAVSIKAMLADALNYNIGEMASFSIKSNDGEQIILKSIHHENLKNLMNDQTMQTALKTAGLAINETTVSLVHNLMKQGLTIDSNTLNTYAKQFSSVPNATAEDLVFMNQLQISVTEDNVASIHRFYDFNDGIGSQAEVISNDVVAMLQGSELDSSNQISELLNTFIGSYSDELEQPEGFAKMVTSDTITQLTTQLEKLIVPNESIALNSENIDLENNLSKITNPRLEELIQVLQNDNSSAKSILLNLADFLTTQNIDKMSLKDFLDLPELKTLIENFVRQEMFLSPENFTNENLKKLYEKILLDNKNIMSNLEGTEKSDGVVRSLDFISKDIEFMNQANQLLSFVQIPLKMSNQNTHGDLYVYRNKKENTQSNNELTAFLHLDMENLGTLDIYVKLIDHNLTTDFKVEDSSILDFIQDHIEELNLKLTNLGYSVESDVSVNNSKSYNFKNDVLEKELPPTEIKRFTFDVRA